MLERLVENWLASAPERGGYEIPFCQALFAKGHRILFRSTHGQLEQGKDLITVDREGTYHAYQLKAGDLTLRGWRDIRGEVEELVGLPLEHPDIPPATPFTAHLVTSGMLKDPARKTIKDWKTTWEREGRRPLELVDRDGLLRLFVDTHGAVFHVSPVDMERYLRLFLADKKDILDKEEFAAFLEASLPLEEELPRRALKRALASVAVLSSYVLQGYQHERNHHAAAEGWMMVTAYMLALLERFPTYLNYCRPSLDLCIEGWESATEALCAEALDKPHWVEGDFIPDYAARGWRTTVLFGTMCSFALFRRAKGEDYGREGDVLKRLLDNLEHVMLWGESAGPHCYSIILFLWLHGQEGMACEWTQALVQLITQLNSPRQRGIGIPDAYVAPQVLLRMRYFGEAPFGPTESFRTHSALLPILVEFLARRGRKRMLKSLWYDISEVDRAEFTLDRPTDFYRWKAKTGSFDTRRWAHPQKWAELVDEAESEVSASDLLCSQFSPLLMPFLLVYPHRFTTRLARFIETTVP